VDFLKIIGLSEGEIFEKYPAFALYPQFRADCGLPLDKAIALIVQIYTPVKEDISELWVIKKKAAENLGYKFKDNVCTNDVVQACLKGTNHKFNAMVIGYLRMSKSPKFSRLVTYIDTLYQKELDLKSGEDNEKTKDIIFVIDQLDSRIESITREILNGDTNEDMTVSLLNEVERVSLGLRPEDIAEKMANGIDPVDIRPYGKNYNFERYGDRTKINPYAED
jgi:hypothetical protein